MAKNIKKLLSLVLAMIMVLSLIPAVSAAETEEEVTADMLQEGLAYRNPITGNIEDKDTYLSGNVKEKLEAYISCKKPKN